VSERKRRRCKRSPQKKRNSDTPLGCSGQTPLRRSSVACCRKA
jgi:hypothetical protein